MKTAIIIGASGLIGTSLTNQLLASIDYKEVRILVRKKLPINSPKLVQSVIDFENLTPSMFQGDDVFCTLGTTIKKAGSKEAFKKIDFEYPLVAAKMALSAGCKQFMIVTAMGADPNSSIFYNQVKGDLEEQLARLNFGSILVFRPSLLLGNRAEVRLGEQFSTVMMKTFDFLIPAKYKAIHVDQVAKAMHKKAQENLSGYHVYENDLLF